MARIKGAVATHKRKRKLFKLTKGYKFGKRNLYRIAKDQANRSLVYAYRDRKRKKRQFRALWITRINAGIRPYGLTYSQLINGLQKSKIGLNRQMLAELAIYDTDAIAVIAGQVKQILGLSN